MKIAIIVAFEKNRGIGNKGRIVWDFPCDRSYFKRLTTGNVVIFGRRTFEEIGRALPGRINIVVSTTKKFEGENLYTTSSLEEAVQLAEKINATSRPRCLLPQAKIFLCGGERIYRGGLLFADEIYTTQIDADYQCDAFFPPIDEAKFTEVVETSTTENGIKLKFITYRLRSKCNFSRIRKISNCH